MLDDDRKVEEKPSTALRVFYVIALVLVLGYLVYGVWMSGSNAEGYFCRSLNSTLFLNLSFVGNQTLIFFHNCTYDLVPNSNGYIAIILN